MNLEQEIYKTVTEGIGEAIKARLSAGYQNNPLNALIDSVVTAKAPELRKVIETAIDGGLQGDLKSALQDAITHKLARVMIGKFEGEIERLANVLRSDPTFRARAVLAIEAAIKALPTTPA